MRGTTTIRLKVEVEVEVDFEYDGRFRQASIVAARLDESRNPLTPRMVYGAMVSGDYHKLDKEAFMSLSNGFVIDTHKYWNSLRKEYPDEEIRSAPLAPSGWHKTMSHFKNAGLPLSMIVGAAEHLGAMIEPVLCKIPTVYLWPQESSDLLSSAEVPTAMMTTKAVDIEQQNDGSWKVTW
jgi:hypothetical protein